MSGEDQAGLDLAGYEPPWVEKVLSPAELEREVLYAGDNSIDQDGG